MSRIVDLVRRAWGKLTGGDAHSSQQAPAENGNDDNVLQAVNVTKNTIVASAVEWAGTSETRRSGLLGRDHIEAGGGMYIVPTQWIHMFGMKFPIDVAFLDSNGRVLFIYHRLKPNRLSRPVWRAEGALELPAGTLETTGTTIGDIIELR